MSTNKLDQLQTVLAQAERVYSEAYTARFARAQELSSYHPHANVELDMNLEHAALLRQDARLNLRIEQIKREIEGDI